LKKKLEKSNDGGLARTPGLAHTVGLARMRPTKKLKGVLSAKARTKRKVIMKSKLPGACIRRRKQKEKE